MGTVDRQSSTGEAGYIDHDNRLRRLRGTMGYVVAVLAVVTSILAAAVTVLVRRERRRTPLSPEAHRFEAAATRGLRDARRQARASRHFADGSGVSALRDRDSRSQ